MRNTIPQRGNPAAFGEFTASQLYCGNCRRATPVRERLLLVLPDGEIREYLCALCGRSAGTRREKQARPAALFIA